jgi:uncharacterized protein YecT (DUF1311 family)
LRIILCLIIASFAVSANAHELGNRLNTEVGRRYTRVYVQCYDQHIEGPKRWGCTRDEFDRQDVVLNATFKRLVSRLAPARRAALRKSQRTWIATRDAKCGTVEPLQVSDPSVDKPDIWCSLDETVKRTIWLERYR